MRTWKQLRVALLAIIGSSVLIALGKAILFSLPSYEPLLVFPEKVPLSRWQWVDSRPLNSPPDEEKKLHRVGGRQYRYRQGKRLLEIEIRYFAPREGGYPDLDVRKLLAPGAAVFPSLEERQRGGIGFYGLGTEGAEAYLISCINPYGETTVTGKQFQTNRQLKPNRLLPWLLGRQLLRDNRCLWSHLSLPLKDTSLDTAYSLLEKAWFSWHGWWQPRFQKN